VLKLDEKQNTLEVSSKTIKFQNIETIYVIKKVKKQFKIIHF